MSVPNSADGEQLIEELAAIVGREYVVHRPEDLYLYELDGSIDRGRPLAVVIPASTDQVAAVIRLAHGYGLPIVPRGAGTGLSGGAVAAEGGITVALTRMRGILEVDAENRTALIEPGVVNLDLTNAVASLGLYYAPDPSSQRACTIGGNVAENSGGPHCLAYGTTANHTLGMEVVLPTGNLLELGSAAPDGPGYDLVSALVGSEGTLGVITKTLVKLLPKPEATRTALAAFGTIEEASEAVSAIIGHGIVPCALEMMDRLTIKAVEAGLKAGYPPDAGAVLLVEVDGLRDELEDAMVAIERICREHQATEVRIARDNVERDRLWLGRKQAIGAFGQLAPNYYLQDGTVPRTRLPEVLRQVGEIGRKYDLPIANVFHAGDGNLHPCILFDERTPGLTERVVQASEEILRACVAVGGTISGEHGIGIEKRNCMPMIFTPADLQTFAWLKAAFNPDGLFNPGKIFPDGKACGELSQRPMPAGLTVNDLI